MTLPMLIPLLAVAAAASGATAPLTTTSGGDWAIVELSPEGTDAAAVDRTRIRTEAAQRVFTAALILSKDQDGAAGMELETAVDCPGRRLRILSGRVQDLDGKMLASAPDGEDWVSVTPGNGDPTLTYVCSNGTTPSIARLGPGNPYRSGRQYLLAHPPKPNGTHG